MRKFINLMLMLLVLSAASVNAQVRIGGNTDPNPSAVLDLNSTDAVNNGTLGFALPRVALLSTTDNTTIPNPVAGLVVYNTAIAGNGLSAVTPGTYVFSEGKWLQLNATQSSSSNYPSPTVTLTSSTEKLFNFYRKQDVSGDPNGPTEAIAPIIFTATVTGGTGTLKYQWYKKDFGSSGDIKLSGNGATTKDYTTPAGDLADWGLNSYYCVVSDNYTSTTTPLAEVAIGCGAKTVSGDWLKFMCYNLGADTSLDPFTWNSVNDSTSQDIKGWLFQWGRVADGHQWRSSTTTPGPYTGTLTDIGQIPESASTFYGRFIISTISDWRSPSDITLWDPAALSNPCPGGWRVPSRSEVLALMMAIPANVNVAFEDAIGNNWSFVNGAVVKPDFETVTLYLPAVGQRDIEGNLTLVGRSGGYRLSTPSLQTGMAYSFGFATMTMATNVGTNRYGGAVRCVAN
jgi:hypothetical protein